MLTQINPKLPMRDFEKTKQFYVLVLGFQVLGNPDFKPYLMVKKENIEIHFFEHTTLKPAENYGQVYIRTENIDSLYQSLIDNKVTIHPNGHLETKPWGQREFSLLDPENNLLTFGQTV